MVTHAVQNIRGLHSPAMAELIYASSILKYYFELILSFSYRFYKIFTTFTFLKSWGSGIHFCIWGIKPRVVHTRHSIRYCEGMIVNDWLIGEFYFAIDFISLLSIDYWLGPYMSECLKYYK